MAFPKKEEKQEVKQEATKHEAKPEVKETPIPAPKPEIKEVLVETKIDTSTRPTSFEDRARIEAEVKMIKIGTDASGNTIFKRSDRITVEDKKKRESMLDKIKKGLPF